MRAGTRRPSLCRASIGWAESGRDRPTEQYNSSGEGGKKASGHGTASAGLSREPSGGANFAKKDNSVR
ncbi:MAG: hypothetical protein WC295_00450 [Methanoregula sp.]